MGDIYYEDIAFLKHYGVKGMSWGQRKAEKRRQKQERRITKNTNKAQDHIDRLSRISDGTATVGDRARVASTTNVLTPSGARRQLDRGAAVQEAHRTGERYVSRLGEVRIADLDYSSTLVPRSSRAPTIDSPDRDAPDSDAYSVPTRSTSSGARMAALLVAGAVGAVAVRSITGGSAPRMAYPRPPSGPMAFARPPRQF